MLEPGMRVKKIKKALGGGTGTIGRSHGVIPLPLVGLIMGKVTKEERIAEVWNYSLTMAWECGATTIRSCHRRCKQRSRQYRLIKFIRFTSLSKQYHIRLSPEIGSDTNTLPSPLIGSFLTKKGEWSKSAPLIFPRCIPNHDVRDSHTHVYAKRKKKATMIASPTVHRVKVGFQQVKRKKITSSQRA